MLGQDAVRECSDGGEPSLVFGDYAFFPLRGAVDCGDGCVALERVEFDAALELFVHQGKTLTIDHLQRMLPHADLEVEERLIWQWLATLPTKLGMGARGWQLKVMGPSSVCLLAPASVRFWDPTSQRTASREPSATATKPACCEYPIPTPPPWWKLIHAAPLATPTAKLRSGQSLTASEPSRIASVSR